MDTKGKSHEVEAVVTPSQTATRKKRKNRKESESDQNEIAALHKKVDQIGNSLNQLTEFVKKRPQNSDKKEIPKEEEYVCLFESEDSDFIKDRGTVFVRGFNCSFPIHDIKTTLINHFSSCGDVVEVSVPHECKTGSPLGFAFINMVQYPNKALKLNGSSLGGMNLEVKMATDSKEYYTYPNFRGCKRCRNGLMKRLKKRFRQGSIFHLPPGLDFKTQPSASPKQDGEANSK